MSVLHLDSLANSGLHNTQHIPLRSFYTSAALSLSIPSNIDSNRPSRGEMFAEFAGRPHSSSTASVPAGPRIPGPSRRKNLSEMIGITSEEEFERLPIAVRRKVRVLERPFLVKCNLRPCVSAKPPQRDPYFLFIPILDVRVKTFLRKM
jgi:hypothetical protein